ncbi:hypothetical protein BDV59DRAFT_10597 [Aspergillus ambiguus]|uniref:uncharacterized protein n=1 Tax=Aspergillus ambiguus TaxID=176160 RepID=UPI003CCDB034
MITSGAIWFYFFFPFFTSFFLIGIWPSFPLYFLILLISPPFPLPSVFRGGGTWSALSRFRW